MYETLILILSEIGLSLYPQLIKLVNTNIETQLAIRFITYSFLAAAISLLTNTEIFKYSLIENIAFGSINLIHVFTSYLAFKLLSSGVSYTLFYTYPIFNLLGRVLLFNEQFSIKQFVYIITAIFGVYLVTNKPQSNNNNIESWSLSTTEIGIIAGLLSAITESIIYLFVKNVKKEHGITPFQELTRFYILGGIIGITFIAYSYYQTTNTTNTQTLDTPKNSSIYLEQFDISLKFDSLIGIILFNALIGFIGYVLRFYIISRTNTIKFNSLIFLGIIFAYIWGFILGGEIIKIENLIGSFIIIFTIYMINY